MRAGIERRSWRHFSEIRIGVRAVAPMKIAKLSYDDGLFELL
jgi:hypothetical protein